MISRKLDGGRVGRSPIRGVEGIGEIFAQILDEKLRGFMRTIVGAVVISCEVQKLSHVLEKIASPAMIGVIAVENAKDSALVNLGPDLTYHIVDLRMGGDPMATPKPVARANTAIDSALCADFISAIVNAFEASLRLNLGPGVSDAMRLSHFEQHVTMVRIAPEHSDVLVMRLSLDIGDAGRSGEFDLVLPLSVLDSYKALIPQDPGEMTTAQQNDIWSSHMAAAASAAPLHLIAVLHRLQLSVSELQALRPGVVLPLPESCRGRVDIGLDTGELLATGRLGAWEGRKAIKLTAAPDAALQEHIRRLTERHAAAH